MTPTALAVYSVLLGVAAVAVFRRPIVALYVFVLGLPLHNIVMSLLYGGGVHGHALDAIQAWKEVLLAGALASVAVAAVRARRLPFTPHPVDWLALAYAAVVFVAARWAIGSMPGHVWEAIRENERRVEVLGLRPLGFKLTAFVLGSFLATLGGIVYVLLIGGASPEVTTANFTLTLLVMVVIGGSGTRWGALIGGAVYTYLDHRLVDLGSSHSVQSLPGVLRTPLSEPLFLLGTFFILLVLFVPGGIAGLAARRPRRGLQRFREALQASGEPVQ